MSLPSRSPSHPLILASTSRYRAQTLAQLLVPFSQIDPQLDETPYRGLPPIDQARTLAELKARAVATPNPQAWVIGADQTGECNGRALHKPGNAPATVAQLMLMRGRALHFYTAVSLAFGDRVETKVTQTRLVMRDLSEDAIRTYVAYDKPYDCAGGFKAEALGIALFESIESDDPSALIGLPLIALNSLFLSFGFALLGE